MRGLRPTKLARSFRQRPSEAERLLWAKRRNRQLNGLKFKRQVPLSGYVADFACLDHHLVVEIDGGTHSAPRAVAHDAKRAEILERGGYIVLRFWNDDVLGNVDGVLDAILAVANNLGPVPPHPVPLPAGERGRKPGSGRAQAK